MEKLLLIYIIVFLFNYINCEDPAYNAIKDVHRYLDNDQDGKIDVKESADYMKSQLKAPNSDRQYSFHNKNNKESKVTIDDLWIKWLTSEVYKWNNDDVIKWLKECVQLPEYEGIFREKKVDGQILPRLSTPKFKYLQDVLKVNNKNHRLRIYLRASDAVLFGAPDNFKAASKPSLIIDQNFEAIKAVHAHLDDDRDGNIDTSESVDYIREELKATEIERHSSFHNNDNEISVDDLWTNWKDSEVYNWTNDQVVTWLVYTVGLPQYEEVFREKNVDGKTIPRLATEKSNYLQKELGVTNATHRSKIYLRASDIILFGAPEVRHNYFNDSIVLVIIILSTLVWLYAFHEKRNTKKLMENMTKDFESLQQAEINLKQMQKKQMVAEQKNGSINEGIERELLEGIEAAKKEASRLHFESSKNQEDKIKLCLVEQELSEVRLALAKTEAEMHNTRVQYPKALQHFLEITYKKETQYVQTKKQYALIQMREAKDACEKVSKTRRSMFGSLRLAHGQTIDAVDQKILDARSALTDVTNDLQERQDRWAQIEKLCNFPIITEGVKTTSSVESNDSVVSFRKAFNMSREHDSIEAENGQNRDVAVDEEGSNMMASANFKAEEENTGTQCGSDNVSDVSSEKSSPQHSHNTEKYLTRAYTEPSNLCVMHFRDSKDVGYFRSTTQLKEDTCKSVESLNQQNISDGEASLSDDSNSSGISTTIPKKKLKGLGKLFHRRSKTAT